MNLSTTERMARYISSEQAYNQAKKDIERWQRSFNYKNTSLSLNYPTLQELPPIPDECQQLILYNCGMERIETLPYNLKTLVLRRCQNLKMVPPLPDGLTYLVIEDCPFAEVNRDLSAHVVEIEPSSENKILYLPPFLEYLDLNGSGIVEIPQQLPVTLTHLCLRSSCVTLPHVFPEGLLTLHVDNQQPLPYLPDSLMRLYYDPFEGQFEENQYGDEMFEESIELEQKHYQRIQEANQMFEWPRSKVRTLARTKLFKEELMMTVWHPNRVQKWLEAGDDVYDMMCGAD